MSDFDLQIRKSPGRKTISIRIYPDNRIVVAAPRHLSQKEIMRFVDAKTGWILKTMEINLEKAQHRQVRNFVSGEKLLYLGEEYTLKVEPVHAPPLRRPGTAAPCKPGAAALGSPGTAAVTLENGSIICAVAHNDGKNLRQMVRATLIRWYSSRALAKINERCPVHAKQIGVSPRSVTLKSMRSRWGSCSTRGTISLAWNIIMAPEPVLDYLIVHEYCHMIHHNHSAEYWKLVESFIPDHRERRKWLRKNGEWLSF